MCAAASGILFVVILGLVVWLAIRVFASGAESEPFVASSSNGPIQVSSSSELDNLLARWQDAVVLCYSPDCPHCTNFIPTFKQAAQEAPRDAAVFAMIELGPSWGAFMNAHSVNAVPTILRLKHGVETAMHRVQGMQTIPQLHALAAPR